MLNIELCLIFSFGEGIVSIRGNPWGFGHTLFLSHRLLIACNAQEVVVLLSPFTNELKFA